MEGVAFQFRLAEKMRHIIPKYVKIDYNHSRCDTVPRLPQPNSVCGANGRLAPRSLVGDEINAHQIYGLILLTRP